MKQISKYGTNPFDPNMNLDRIASEQQIANDQQSQPGSFGSHHIAGTNGNNAMRVTSRQNCNSKEEEVVQGKVTYMNRMMQSAGTVFRSLSQTDKVMKLLGLYHDDIKCEGNMIDGYKIDFKNKNISNEKIQEILNQFNGINVISLNLNYCTA